MEYTEYENDFTRDFESFMGDMFSRSYVPQKNGQFYDELYSELADLFNKFSKNGVITEKNKTECYFGQI